MIDYLDSQSDETNPLFHLEDQLHRCFYNNFEHSYSVLFFITVFYHYSSTTTGDRDDIREKCKIQEDVLRTKMVAMEKIVLENSVLCKKQEEAAAMKIKALEEELQHIRENPSTLLQNNTKNVGFIVT